MTEGSLSRNTGSTSEKGKWGCLIALAASQAFFIAIILITALCVILIKSSARNHPSRYGIDEHPFMEEIWSAGAGKTKIVVIPVRGFIGFDENEAMFSSGVSSTAVLLNSIKRATADDKISGIILDVDSGGGGITASDIIYRALRSFKESRSDRKIVVLMGDVAASGAYYVSLPADKIIAHPTSITGSIGVLMQSINLKGLGDRIGVRGITIKSGRNKDLLNPFEDVSDEHRLILQGIVDELQERFVSLVASERKLPEANVRELADGRVFSANRALEYGLIDAIGYWADAVSCMKTLLGSDDMKIYRYERRFSLSSLFTGSTDLGDIKSLLPSRKSSGFYYLWDPSIYAME